jgi:plasmid stabilization system protein ParE
VAQLPLEILAAASEETLTALAWYRERSEAAAVAFADEVRLALDRIQRSPETWTSHDHGTHRTLLRRFPYEIVYRLLPDKILVVAIAHSKRKPGYWRGR